MHLPLAMSTRKYWVAIEMLLLVVGYLNSCDALTINNVLRKLGVRH